MNLWSLLVGPDYEEESLQLAATISVLGRIGVESCLRIHIEDSVRAALIRAVDKAGETCACPPAKAEPKMKKALTSLFENREFSKALLVSACLSLGGMPAETEETFVFFDGSEITIDELITIFRSE